MRFLSLLLLLISVDFLTAKRTYQNYKLYRIQTRNYYFVETISLLYDNSKNFDFWTNLREPGQNVDIAVAPIAQPSFENILYQLNITNEVQIEKIHRALNNEKQEQAKAPKVEKGKIDFLQYHRYDTIVDYLKNLEETYEFVTLENIGKTNEDRDIPAVKISTGGNSSKPIVLLDAGLSPREWIGTAQALYIIRELVENSNNKELITNVDWYVVPLVNPDGYEFTHTQARLWKKNVWTTQKNRGVYLNRNFDIAWGEHLSSTVTTDWHFQGPRPFSEPETRALKTFIETNASRMKLYLSFHSFGPTLLYPYGYTLERPDNLNALRSLAREASVAIEENGGDTYKVKPSSTRGHKFSGSSVDWAMKVARIPFVYTVELPSPGYLGFDFLPYKLNDVLKEFMFALRAFHKRVEADLNTFVPNEEDVEEDFVEEEEEENQYIEYEYEFAESEDNNNVEDDDETTNSDKRNVEAEKNIKQNSKSTSNASDSDNVNFESNEDKDEL